MSMAVPRRRAAATIPFNASIDCAKAASDRAARVRRPALPALDQKLGTVYKEAEAKQGSPASGMVRRRAARLDQRDADDCGASSEPEGLRRLRVYPSHRRHPGHQPPGAHQGPGDLRVRESRRTFTTRSARCLPTPTRPPSVLERGDKSIVAYFVRSRGGATYEGDNVTFVDRGGEVAGDLARDTPSSVASRRPVPKPMPAAELAAVTPPVVSARRNQPFARLPPAPLSTYSTYSCAERPPGT